MLANEDSSDQSAAIFLQETSANKNFVMFQMEKCSNEEFDIREFALNSGDDMTLQSVSHSTTDGLINIVVKSSSDFRIMVNVNMKDVTDTTWTEYRPSMTA